MLIFAKKAIGLFFSLGVCESAHFSSKSKAIGLQFSLKLVVCEGAHFSSKSKTYRLTFFAKIGCF